jgi:hypothetical protein
MKPPKNKVLLTFFYMQLFLPTVILAQGTDIAMENLAHKLRIIANIFLALALTNLVLSVCYWFTKTDWLAFIILILSVPCFIFGLAAYHDEPWIAKVALLSGALPVLIPLLRKIFKTRP